MLNPLDKRYIGSVCEIRSFSNQLLAVGIITELGEDYVKIRAKDERMILLNTTAKIKLNIFNSQAGFTVLICEVLTSTSKKLKIVEPIRITDHERRNGFRVALELSAKISMRNVFAENAKTEHLQIVCVKDLSVCGLRLFSALPFIQGQIIWIDLDLDGYHLITKAQIIRAGEINDDTEDDKILREYGVRFLFDKDEDNDRLCSYLFKKQRENAQRIK